MSAETDLFADKLIALGFLDALASDQATEVEAALRKLGWQGIHFHPWRFLHADDEAIAEAGVGEFLQSAAPILAKLGLEPLVGEDVFDEETEAHLLELPDETVTIVSAEERQEERAGRRKMSWGLAYARVQYLLNRRLERAGRADRFYALYGGNDCIAAVLTPSMLELILSQDLPLHEQPYTRTDHWPDFGMPAARAARSGERQS